MELACSTCGAPFRAEDLNLDYGIATCRYCRAITKLPKTDPGEAVPAPGETPQERSPVPMPKSITVEDWGANLKISWRWFSPMYLFLAFFCVAWDSFLVFWYWMAVGGMGDAPGPFRLLFFVFPMAHVAVGVGLTYFVIAGFLNRSVIEVATGELSIRHGPVPWRGNQTIPVDDIDQLYCQLDAGRRRNASGAWTENSSGVTYRVNALLKNGRKETLVSKLFDLDQALFIEQKLEDALGIEDRRVSGELER